jgi:hypothetical protein
VAWNEEIYRKIYKELRPLSKTENPQKQIAPFGEVDAPERPIEINSLDITGPYSLKPRKNKYLLTFMDTFIRYVEVYPISEQSAEFSGRIYATEIVTRHDVGSKLITDQVRNFVIFSVKLAKYWAT